MDDQQRWQQAIAATHKSYQRLSVETRDELDDLLDSIMQIKQELFELVQAAGSSEICRDCGGQCCLNGKYHVTELDLLAYLRTDAEPVRPDFGTRPLCPYGGTDGCRMEPRFRSMTCLIFNCDLIEERMGSEDKQRLVEFELNLRRAVEQAEKLLGYRAGRALLLH